jgi:hypothetical protein
MNNTFFIIILIIIALLYFNYNVISPEISSIVQETKSSIIVSKGTHKNYLIDESDISYHKENKSLLKTFNDELKSRGLTYTPSPCNFRRPVLSPLEIHIINNIIPPIPNVVDTQNVHDTNIQKQLKSRYKDLSVDNQNILFNENDIISHAFNSKKDISTLSNIIQEIKNRNSSVTNFNSDNEYTVLKNTWMSGNDNVKDQIINNLLDCEEDEILVCPTGTTSRIIESTYIDNPEDMPKTKDMFMTEMLSKASLIRNTLESSISHLDEYEQSEILKRNIIKSYNTDYKDILSEDQINNFTKDWIDSI